MKFIYKLKDLLIEEIPKILPKIMYSAIILFIGYWIIKFTVRGVSKVLSKSKIDKSAHSFIKSGLDFFLKGSLIVIVLKNLGFPESALIGVLSAVGLSIGLALRDILSNFAGGFLIMMFRIVKVGDVIQIEEFVGSITEIRIFFTKMITADNRNVIIPNGDIVRSKIIKLNTEDERRIDIDIKISNKSDISKAKEIIKNIVDENISIIRKENTLISVESFEENFVLVTVKVWSKTEDYWVNIYNLRDKIKEEFFKVGIE